MKNFTGFLLIGIILTLISFLVVGVFSDGNMILNSKIRIEQKSQHQVIDQLSDLERIPNWLFIFQEEGVNYAIDESEESISWTQKKDGPEMTLFLKPKSDQVTYLITAKQGGDTKLIYSILQDGSDLELACDYEIEIPLIYRFFSKSIKEKLEEKLDLNMVELKTFLESKN
ncbi:MAG: hypothetical protein ACPG4W_05860 [Flavobacteriales bacterium]